MKKYSIAFIASETKDAQEAFKALKTKYEHVSPQRADVLVVLGGDGMILKTLTSGVAKEKLIYGMNKGTVGFLLNTYSKDQLNERIEKAEEAKIYPLKMIATDIHGVRHTSIAINEVSLLRQTKMTAKIKILLDQKIRIPSLVCDGVLLATPAGSTAYNLSARGPILPLDASLLALTPICAFRPRRWPGAIISDKSEVCFEVINPDTRPVSTVAGELEVRDAHLVTIKTQKSINFKVLFDPERNLKDRILNEQFVP